MSSSFVFRVTDPREVKDAKHKRWGFQGQSTSEALYNGLLNRTQTVFELPRAPSLRLFDNNGHNTILIHSYDDWKSPEAQHILQNAPKDSKGRLTTKLECVIKQETPSNGYRPTYVQSSSSTTTGSARQASFSDNHDVQGLLKYGGGVDHVSDWAQSVDQQAARASSAPSMAHSYQALVPGAFPHSFPEEPTHHEEAARAEAEEEHSMTEKEDSHQQSKPSTPRKEPATKSSSPIDVPKKRSASLHNSGASQSQAKANQARVHHSLLSVKHRARLSASSQGSVPVLAHHQRPNSPSVCSEHRRPLEKNLSTGQNGHPKMADFLSRMTALVEDTFGAGMLPTDHHRNAPEEKPIRVEPKATPPVSNASPVKHDATCDICDKQIVGVRNKCLQCPDYDVCDGCMVNVPHLHPHHQLLPIKDDVKIHILASHNVIHPHVTCDHCDRYIRGIRYKCTHPACPDYDLCQNCEALPDPVHPEGHVFLKLRHPVQRNILIRGREASQAYVNKSRLSQTEGGGPALNRFVDLDVNVQQYPCSVEVVLDAEGKVERYFVKDASQTNRHAASSGRQECRSFSRQCSSQSNADVAHRNPAQVPQAPEKSGNNVTRTVMLGADPERTMAVTELKNQLMDAPIESRVNTPLWAKYVADITIDDGTMMPPNALFTKTWTIKNAGQRDWPEGTQLVHVGGFSVDSNERSVNVPALRSGTQGDISIENLKAPEAPGKYMSFWRFSHEGQKFGDRLWIEINVESDMNGTDHTADSLSASSVRLPQPASDQGPSKAPSMAETASITETDVHDEFTAESECPEGDEEFVFLSDDDEIEEAENGDHSPASSKGKGRATSES